MDKYSDFFTTTLYLPVVGLAECQVEEADQQTRILTTYTREDTGYPVMVTDDDGLAGTWEIKNLIITEN